MKSANHPPSGPIGIGRSPPLHIVDRRIEELRPDPGNPRHHSKKQIRQIAASIRTFGFNVLLPDFTNRDISEEPVYGLAESAVPAEAASGSTRRISSR